MKDITGNTFFFNGESRDLSEFDNCQGLMLEHPSVYEVMRIEEGVVLFMEDYMERLQNSFSILAKNLPVTVSAISETVKSLIITNGITSGPVKLVFGAGNHDFFLAYLMHPHLPKSSEYLEGVKVILMKEVRENPGLKLWNNELRERSIDRLKVKNAFEAILVNPDGCITEASRSNVFFIKDHIVYTTPEYLVLPGITRKKVIEVCKSAGIELVYKEIYTKELEQYDACFTTGTARKIVPVKEVEKVKYDVSNSTLHKVAEYFEVLVEKYISLKN